MNTSLTREQQETLREAKQAVDDLVEAIRLQTIQDCYLIAQKAVEEADKKKAKYAKTGLPGYTRDWGERKTQAMNIRDAIDALRNKKPRHEGVRPW